MTSSETKRESELNLHFSETDAMVEDVLDEFACHKVLFFVCTRHLTSFC